mmetsp:Transcript_11421/g.13009  ORF Transcript_11421/g.13009 Transcript_11421/m.13009 type:complete len:484 (-) Transcript_11421:1880-3331(-)
MTSKLENPLRMNHLPFNGEQLIKYFGTSAENLEHDYTYFEISRNKLYKTVLSFVQRHHIQGNQGSYLTFSYECEPIKDIHEDSHPFSSLLKYSRKKRRDSAKETNLEVKQKKIKNKVLPGLGLFELEWEERTDDSVEGENQKVHRIHVLHQSIGEPNQHGLRKNVILFVKGRGKAALLQKLVDFMVEDEEKEKKKEEEAEKKYEENKISIYNWPEYGSEWDKVRKTFGRSIESVVLPKKIKDSVLEDVDDFLSEENKAWYMEHGVPYKRCYLFYGVPGSGKTSLISALATMYKLNVCYLDPSRSRMDDEKVKKALYALPRNSIVIIEDVDALFTDDRRKLNRHSDLTFSGLLNALDGVGSASGQIIILSTNYRDRLDPALLRNGRVDMQIHFDFIQKPEAEKMFGLYYKNSTNEERRLFSKNLFGRKSKLKVTAAALQHFFIKFRKKTIQEAIDNVEEFVKVDLEERQTAGEKMDADSMLFYM